MTQLTDITSSYIEQLKICLGQLDEAALKAFAERLVICIQEKQTLFICGNGGSGANSNHAENDFVYGVSKMIGKGVNAVSLSANSAVISCLANDEGYHNIFSYQLRVKAKAGDVLLVLSGSGNSQNIIEAIKHANEMGVETFAILGFDGGKAKTLVNHPIHFDVNDMQISEDLQMILLHMISQWLYRNKNQLFK